MAISYRNGQEKSRRITVVFLSWHHLGFSFISDTYTPMPFIRQELGVEDWHNYEVESRREIIALLRTIGEKNQLIRLMINSENDVAVTSILDVDPDNNEVILDCSIDKSQNSRIVSAKRITFETSIDKIRIIFSASKISSCTYEDRPALSMPIPPSLIRLQRRELYRMTTPMTKPVRCLIPLPPDLGEGTSTFPLADISGGGIALLDDKLILDNTIGRVYKNCSIDLPDTGIVSAVLQLRSSYDLTLLNGKTNRRLGFKFLEIARSMQANVQRYIMKLERERNAKATGLG